MTLKKRGIKIIKPFCKCCKNYLIHQRQRKNMYCCETKGCDNENLCYLYKGSKDTLDKQIDRLKTINKELNKIDKKLRRIN